MCPYVDEKNRVKYTRGLISENNSTLEKKGRNMGQVDLLQLEEISS
jgi:hypothetical protein